MSQFSRRAKWLNAIFTASKAPQVRDPDQRSDDVSLVQAYDGGGWNFNRSGDWFIQLLGAAGATVETELLQVPDDQIVRLYSAEFGHAAGLSFNAQILVRPQDGPTAACMISEQRNSMGVGNPNEMLALNGAGCIVPPGARIIGLLANGTVASSTAIWTIYFARAPVGTVFGI